MAELDLARALPELTVFSRHAIENELRGTTEPCGMTKLYGSPLFFPDPSAG